MELDDVTVNFSEGGVERVRQLDKLVLSQSSSWATVAFLFCELDPETAAPRPPKLSLRRFKKRAGRYVLDKHFVISSARQAQALSSVIARWFPGEPVDAATGEHEND